MDQRHHLEVFLLGGVLLTVGLALVVLLVPKRLRELRRAKDADALKHWRRSGASTQAAIQHAWRSGTAVENRDAALLAVEMSQHNDRVLTSTKQISWWSCLPILPGLLLLLASTNLPRFVWLLILAPIGLVLVTHPLTVRSRKRRQESVELTKRQHGLA